MKKQTAQVMNDIVSTTRVSVFIEAMNMLLNPLVFHTGAEYKKKSLCPVLKCNCVSFIDSLILRKFLGAQSLLGVARGLQSTKYDEAHHMILHLKVSTQPLWCVCVSE